MYASNDWTKYVLDKPMVAEPGSEFVYCSGCSHVLMALVNATGGVGAPEFARQYLLEPIGIMGEYWELASEGIPIGGWGLNITPRQMARLGYLYLHEGQWQGKQVVSADWVRQATQSQVEQTGLDYGYQWWIDTETGGYAAMGLYGQTIYVLPRLDLVIVFTAQEDDHDREFQLIREYIIPAVKE
jgi:CubicO group peptidase (beta-lactamase class C family)